MAYPNTKDFQTLVNYIVDYADLQSEYGAEGLDAVLADARAALQSALERIQALPPENAAKEREPDELPAILALRTDGPRRMLNGMDEATYRNKLEGAFSARIAGCLLGAPVENWLVSQMQAWADYTGDAFPPTDYWSKVVEPKALRYGKSVTQEFARSEMKGIPVDDDICYTLLGMLIAEDYGVDFTVDDVGKAWVKYLPLACTAEDAALRNLKNGIPAEKAAEIMNPWCQWIGADIRSDPWAYMAPAWPEKAAELAYRDAYLTHRRNGLYGAMYFAAAESAAFAVDNAVDALKIGLTEIPKDCALYRDVAWALEAGKELHTWQDARQAVDDRFPGMNRVHTNNNACLTIFGLMLGGNDISEVISQTVAMGLDNDCTAATAGSIVGAIVGKEGFSSHWSRNWNDTVYSYLNGIDSFRLSDLLNRFTALAKKFGAIK